MKKKKCLIFEQNKFVVDKFKNIKLFFFESSFHSDLFFLRFFKLNARQFEKKKEKLSITTQLE